MKKPRCRQRAVSLFFLVRRAKRRETRKLPRAWLKARSFLASRGELMLSHTRTHALPSPNLKKKRDCSRSKQGVKGVTREGFDFPTFPKLFTSTLSEAKERDHRGPSWASTDSRSWPDDISYISSFPAYKYIANKEKGIICLHSS